MAKKARNIPTSQRMELLTLSVKDEMSRPKLIIQDAKNMEKRIASINP